ncbi:MAG: lipopolysaccharide transport periplasmic protein LptA, partial [Ramlibacter sp.]
MNRPFLTSLLVLATLLVAPAVRAEKADRNKPMNVEADALRHDDLSQTSVFTGQVVATKGSILIRGARLQVRQDPEGYQYGVVTAEPGKRAFWRQKREGVDEYIEGEGTTIEYDGKA